MAARKTKPKPEIQTPDNQPGGKTQYRNGVPAFGWYRMPDEWWRHLPRLQRGLGQRMLIEYIWSRMIPREQGAEMPEMSVWLSYVEVAELLRCSPEQIRDDARDAAKRGLIVLKESKRLGFCARITWERWGNLKDYVPPRPVAVEKPERQVRWLSRAVEVRAGETFDLPKLDAPVERISLRNTSEGAKITIGAGSCEGGVLVLETSAETSPLESKVSDVIRESTPVAKQAKPKPERKDTSAQERKKPADPVIQQICDAIGTYGPVGKEAIVRLVAAAHAPADRVLQACAEIHPPENADNPVGWMLRMIPRYLAGAYQPRTSKKKPTGAEGRRITAIEEALRKAREREGKIA